MVSKTCWYLQQEKVWCIYTSSIFGSNELNVSSFIFNDQTKDLLYSSINHFLNKDPNKGKQDDEYNCEI